MALDGSKHPNESKNVILLIQLVINPASDRGRIGLRILLPLILMVVTVTALAIGAMGDYEWHIPIRISGDSDFNSDNGVVTGTGGSTDPYIISGWDIDSGTDTAPIVIEDTRSHFIIEDMQVKGHVREMHRQVFFTNVSNGVVRNVTFLDPSQQLFWFEGVDNVVVKDLPNTVHIGFVLDGCNNVDFYDIKSCSATISSSTDCSIVRCIVDDSYGFIIYLGSRRIRVIDCSASECGTGILIYRSYDCTIEGGVFNDSRMADIELRGGSGHRLRNCTLGKRGLVTVGYHDSSRGHDIDTSNTIAGEPIYYLYRGMDKVIDFEVGQVILDGCRNITIVNQSFQALWVGVQVTDSADCVLKNLYIDAVLHGFLCDKGRNITLQNVTSIANGWDGGGYRSSVCFVRTATISVQGCRVECVEGDGIYFHADNDLSTRVRVMNTTSKSEKKSAIDFYMGSNLEFLFDNCTFHNSSVGLYLQYSSRSTTLIRCTFERCYRGIVFDGAQNCIVYHNTFLRCYRDAFEVMEGSSAIQIFHNNLMMNCYSQSSGTYSTKQASSDEWVALDRDALGNYWADYTQWYPDANRTGLVWDIPYQLKGQAGLSDKYPLAIPIDFVPPTSNAGRDQTVPQNTTVTLDGSKSWDNYHIDRYRWEVYYLGDRHELPDKTVEFTFDMPGEYRAVLTVWDGWNNSDADEVTITVLDTEPPHVVDIADINVDMQAPFDLDASASWDNVGIVNFTWSIDPSALALLFYGPTVEGAQIGEPGGYEGTLTVHDAAGNLAKDTFSITVLDVVPPTAVAGPPQEVEQGFTVILNGTGSSDNVAIADWIWTFEYGNETVVLHGPMASFVFEVPGIYQVLLEVVDVYGLSSKATTHVAVQDIIPPVPSMGSDTEIGQHEVVTFDGSASTDNVGIVSWTFTFEYDGGTIMLEGPTASFTFDEVGEYTVLLNVTDEAGNWARKARRISVLDTTLPTAEAGIDLEVQLLQQVTFNGSSSTDNVGIIRFEWSIETQDGPHVIEGGEVNYTFERLGTFNVTLRVTDAAGNSATDVIVVTVVDTVLPLADAGEDASATVSRPLTIDGSGSSDNVGVTNWTWSFEHLGEDIELYGISFEFAFEEPGTYLITLTVRDDAGNEASDTVNVTVHDYPGGNGNGGDSDGDSSKGDILVMAIAAAVIAIVAIAAILLLARRRGSTD